MSTEGGGWGGEEERRRRGGINAAEWSEPAALEDVSPPRQDVCSHSAHQPRRWARRRGNRRARHHLPAGDPRRADPRPVEPDHTADQQAAGKINNC